MGRPKLALVEPLEPNGIRALIPSWQIHLEGEGKSAKTIRNYLQAGEQFADFLADHDLPTDPALVTKEHVDRFRIYVRDRQRARGKDGSATSNTRRAAILQFFNWCIGEAICTSNPVAATKVMKEPETEVPVVAEDTIRALFKTCEGTSFMDRRDTAILSCYVDTGARLSELLVNVDDVDLSAGGGIHVIGKGGKHRFLPIGRKTRRDLDRYLRARARHEHADVPELWLGTRGALKVDGIDSMIERRCKQAGIDPINLHRFRHTFCHEWLANGGNEHDLARIVGWSSTQMVARYAKSAAAERARAAHRQLSPRDRI